MKRLTAILFTFGLALMVRAETRLGDVVMKDVVVLEPVDKTNLLNTVKAWAAGVVDDAVTAESVARAAGDTVARTNLQAAINAEAQARAAGDLVSMTNWQARVNALTNGAALGATALQPSWAATGLVARAEWVQRLGDTDGWVEVADDGTAQQVHVSLLANTNIVIIVASNSLYSASGYPVASAGVYRVTMDWGQYSSAEFGVRGVLRYGRSNTEPYSPDFFWHIERGDLGIPEEGRWQAAPGAFDLPQTLTPTEIAGMGSPQGTATIDWLRETITNRVPIATEPDIAAATNFLVQTYLLGTNAWMSISNQTLTIWRETNGVPGALWSSAESEGGGGVDPAFTNAVWAALAAKGDAAWGTRAPDGSANPDPAYMTYINSPAIMHASGFQWATFGAYSVMAESGAVAYESGTDGTARWGLDLQTNYVGFVRGGSVIVAARAGSITVTDGGTTNGLAEIAYPYTSGDFPSLWHAPALDVPFVLQEGVVWVDNQNGTATVTAPATAPKGFWYATTTSTYDVMFDIRPPARLTGGVIGSTNDTAVVYDSTITISTGGKNYRIPAQEVP